MVKKRILQAFRIYKIGKKLSCSKNLIFNVKNSKKRPKFDAFFGI